jgi:putative hemolysin
MALEIFFIFVLLIINGLFAMSEIAVVSARRIRLQQRAAAGNAGAQTAIELADEPDKFLSTVQIGITLVGILSGAFGGAAVASRLVPFFEQFPVLAPYAETVSFAFVVLIITYFSLVIGELVPKTIALNAPETVASLVSRPMRFISKATSPAVWFLSFSTTLLLKILRLNNSNEAAVTEDEIRAMIAQGTSVGVFEEAEQDLLESIIRLDDKNISALMTLRQDIAWIDINDSLEEIRRELSENNYSRLLVCEGDLDNIRGYVKAKDLLNLVLSGEDLNLETVLKQPIFAPTTNTALELLETFKTSHTHLAVIIDEFGTTQGLVTINDVVEEIVGDFSLGGADEKSFFQRDDGSWLLDGRLSTVDFSSILGLKELPAEEKSMYQTLAGFMIKRLEKMPAKGDKFEWDGYVFEVVDMDGKRIDEVLATPIKNLKNNFVPED